MRVEANTLADLKIYREIGAPKGTIPADRHDLAAARTTAKISIPETSGLLGLVESRRREEGRKALGSLIDDILLSTLPMDFDNVPNRKSTKRKLRDRLDKAFGHPVEINDEASVCLTTVEINGIPREVAIVKEHTVDTSVTSPETDGLGFDTTYLGRNDIVYIAVEGMDASVELYKGTTKTRNVASMIDPQIRPLPLAARDLPDEHAYRVTVTPKNSNTSDTNSQYYNDLATLSERHSNVVEILNALSSIP